MATYTLLDNFNTFFKCLNPSPSFEQVAAREYGAVTNCLLGWQGALHGLSPTIFLQGSYRQQTAIYTINDVDLVVLLMALHSASHPTRIETWTRDRIFTTVAEPLLNSPVYKPKVRYNAGSMCVKLDLGIKIEILPVVKRMPDSKAEDEPFMLYRPQKRNWEVGFARRHQKLLTEKNASVRTAGNFKPMIKVLKHLRSLHNVDAVSFHIECLLYNLPDYLLVGYPADYIPAVLSHIAAMPASSWWRKGMPTPCGERDILTDAEWGWERWYRFHANVVTWAPKARAARDASDPSTAITRWKSLLGNSFFPAVLAA